MKREMLSMINRQDFSRRVRSAIIPVTMLAIWATNGTTAIRGQQSTQPTFPSAADASTSLFKAVQGNNEDAITKLLGGPTDLTSSGEEGQDRLDRELFAQRYQEMHRLGREADGSMTLYIGAENWPFPIPLIEKNGAWHFDSEAGLKEVMFRRIGENEFTAIATCHDFLAAEKNYRPPANTEAVLESSPTSLVAKAASGSGGGDPVLFHGYYFKVLTRDTGGKTAGGFAFIAYPAEYRSSGVMTFIITKNDVVYEKDLGPNTAAVAKAMTTFRRDATWFATEE